MAPALSQRGAVGALNRPVASAVPTQSAAPVCATPGRGVVLICDQVTARSPLIGGDLPGGDERELYLALFSGILARSELNVVFHISGRDREPTATAAAIGRWRRELPPADESRFRAVDGVPLEALLGEVDLCVSFASPALALACRRGFKPVQIGRAVIGSDGFTHVFADCGSFVDRLARGEVCGRLSLDEYSEFERFANALRGGAARGGDPILQAFRGADGLRLSLRRVIGDILANPIGALRLLIGTLAGLLGRRSTSATPDP